MRHFFYQKILTPFMALLLGICCIMGTAAVCLGAAAEREEQKARTNEQLYWDAVLDAVTIEEGEVLPLVTITAESDRVEWREGRVLLATVNHHPERYQEGETITLPGEVWTVTEEELSAWYAEHREGVTDWTLRLKQLVGVPADGEYTHVTAMWVSPEDVRRPAYSTDITGGFMPTALPEDTTEEYRDWFEGNIIWSYFDSAYPWTRLGYTYDWAADSGEYGLTEFWVRPEAEVTIEYTDTIDEFIDRMEQSEQLTARA